MDFKRVIRAKKPGFSLFFFCSISRINSFDTSVKLFTGDETNITSQDFDLSLDLVSILFAEHFPDNSFPD